MRTRERLALLVQEARQSQHPGDVLGVAPETGLDRVLDRPEAVEREVLGQPIAMVSAGPLSTTM